MKPVYERFIENPDFTKSEFVELIKCAEDPEAVRRLKEEAVRIREIYYGKKVFTRGLIEYTNYCKNDCYYCGIRKSNTNAKRYRLTEDEIMACCEMCIRDRSEATWHQSMQVRRMVAQLQRWLMYPWILQIKRQ